MTGPAINSEHDSFLTTSPVFPLMCGIEFLPRPVRLSQESQRDYGQFSQLARLNNWRFDRQRIQLFLQNPSHTLVVTDHRQSIQFVNQGFSRMTGYSSNEALNRYPAFLQGPDTNPNTKLAIRTCLATGQPFTGDVLNYRKNGEPYWCGVSIEPVLNHDRQIVNYVAFEREIASSTKAFELR